MTIIATRYLGVVGALVAGVLLFIPCAGSGDRPPWPISFDSEIVRIFVEEDSLRIEGIYTLLCRPRAKMSEIRLFYPYPKDSLLGGARTLSLDCRGRDTTWTALRFAESARPEGARWWVPLDRGDTLAVRTVYRQARLGSYARYIVTTTSAWGQPLSRARFEIYLPGSARDPVFSFPFEPGFCDGTPCHIYIKEQFLPDHDITVTWQPGRSDGEQ